MFTTQQKAQLIKEYELERERERREQIREYYKDDLWAFTRDGFKSFTGNELKHHYTVQYVCEYLEALVKGEIEVLILNIVRGWGKTIFGTVITPAWALLRDPTERIPVFSKNMQTDPKLWHEQTNKVLTSDFVKQWINPNAVSSYNAFVLRTPEGGYRRMQSTNAPAVGGDFTMVFMDDPQGEDHISSQAKRNKLYHTVYDAGIVSAQRTVDYSNANNFDKLQLTDAQRNYLIGKQKYTAELDAYITAELENDARQRNFKQKASRRTCINMQRLFPKDFTSHVESHLRAMEEAGVPQPHRKVVIPAIHDEPIIYVFPKTKQEYRAEAGEFVLSSTITEENILQKKAQMHSSLFQAHFQQNPVSIQGQLINTNDFKRYKQEDLQQHFEKIIITTDFASKAEDNMHSDYSVVACWGITRNRDLYLLDMARMQGGGLKVDTMFENFIKKWNKVEIGKIYYIARNGYFYTKDGSISNAEYHRQVFQTQQEAENVLQEISQKGYRDFSVQEESVMLYLDKVFIENVGSSQHIAEKFRVFMKSEGFGDKITMIPRTKTKFPRFLEVAGPIQNGKIFIPDKNVFIRGMSINNIVNEFLLECENFREYKNEYKNDDMVDTLFDAAFQASTIKIYAPVYRDVSTI